MTKDKMKEKRLGEGKINNQGFLMKIIDYTDYCHITVEFQDDYKTQVSSDMGKFNKGKIKNPNYRLGKANYNKQGFLMKIVEYKDNLNIVVEFTDYTKTRVKTNWRNFINGNVRNPNYKMNIEKYNNKNELMKCIKYNAYNDIIVKFQDIYGAEIHTAWNKFIDGEVKNPYTSSVCGIGIIGNKYPITINNKTVKEYSIWHSMLNRCYDIKFKNKNKTYKDVTCCEEWLFYEHFYEWMHSQENFDKLNNSNIPWSLDKDILVKGNKLYSPKTCCLVPMYINCLFTKSDSIRGKYPIGVHLRKDNNLFCSYLSKYDIQTNKKNKTFLGFYNTAEEAFLSYKDSKEDYIKQTAKEAYNKGNITEQCYNAMINYKVEITD